MPKIDIGFGSLISAVFSFETQSIQGKDGPEFPVLVVPYELQLYAYKNVNEPGMPVHPVTCLYIAGELWSPQQKVAARFHDDIAYYAPDLASQHTTRGNLEIPLDILTVARIEQARTGELVAALKLRALLALHTPGSNQNVQTFGVAEAKASGFTIPKSHWVDRILPRLGYDRLELFEVRLSSATSSDHGLPKAVGEIRQARDFLVDGEWDKAVAHCRNAIETIPGSRPVQLSGTPTFGLRVDTFVQEQLGNRLQSEQAKMLADGMKSLWSVCSRSVHPSSSGGFTRPDAEFIVRNTMAIVEYVGKLLSQ
jgi:hypothetical protein